MHPDLCPYLELHDAMADVRGDRSSPKLLADWLRRFPGEARWLDSSRRRGGPYGQASKEQLWRLYALNRVIEVMNLSFQPGEVTAGRDRDFL